MNPIRDAIGRSSVTKEPSVIAKLSVKFPPNLTENQPPNICVRM
jgi:hypothetical protein